MAISINILDKFNDDVKVKASAAIDELAARGKSQEWIETAFAQKTTEEWEKWGFGLLFRKSFQEQVDKACGKVKESIAAKGPDFSQSPQDDDKNWVLEHYKELFGILSCSSWTDVKAKLTPSNFGEAPMLYNASNGEWYGFNKEWFTRSPYQYNNTVAWDERNFPAIRYALSNNIVPQELIADFERVLEEGKPVPAFKL